MDKLDLAQSGAILFLGTMNAMPMMYALELKKLGQEVIYVVDSPQSDQLSRPEHHYQDISYPYPDWIVEMVLPSQLIVSGAPLLFLSMLRRKIPAKQFKAVFFGGQFIALAKYFSADTKKIILSYGADLEWFCNPAMVEPLVGEYKSKSFLKFLPESIRRWLLTTIVNRNYQGALHSNDVLFFPRGFSLLGDEMVSRLQERGLQYIPRLDVSFVPLAGFSRDYKPRCGKLKILSPVRFHYQNISEQASGENKGNDLIIQALANYVRRNTAVEIHFFDKGPDVENAKSLCQDLGLSPYVIWHQPMPLPDLLRLYQDADICFDQVGNHWMGAVGIYALYFGKPLIVNAKNMNHLPGLPVFQASSEQEIFDHLYTLENEETARAIYLDARNCAEDYFGPQQVLSGLIDQS